MIKINLLPKEARKRVGVAEQIVLIVGALVATLAIIGFVWSYLNGVIEDRQNRIADTQRRLDELKKVIAEIEAFEKQRAALEQKLAIIAELQKEQQLPVHLLDEVYLTLEDDVWLSSFSLSGNRLTFQGTALSNPVVADYTRSLEASPYFGEVELRFSNKQMIGDQEVRNFQITAVLTVPANFLEPSSPQQE
jgi:type IV pilus assembly protein PilN